MQSMAKVLLILLLVITTALSKLIPIENAFGICILGILLYLCREKFSASWQKILLWLLMVPLTFWIATWRPQDFSYPLLMHYVSTDGANQFSLYANLSKGLVGFCLLIMLWPTVEQQRHIFPKSWRVVSLLLSPLLIIGLAIVLFDLKWEPKSIQQILIFSAANILLTCIAEEAFMRFLLQQPMILAMSRWTRNPWFQEAVPLFLVTAVFVAIHSGVKGSAIWVYGLAGLLYGLSYTLSKNIFYPIAVHAAVNILHFSVLTYPL